jgi:phage portal protein BeeE
MLLDIDLAGNAYIWKAEPELLVRLEPEYMSIVSEEKKDTQGRKYRTLVGYWWDPKATAGQSHPSEDAEFFLPEEIAHWAPIPDPDVRFRGESWLSAVLRDITSDQALTEYKLRYLYQAATPNLVLQYKQRLQKETVDALRTRMEQRYGGVDNAFRTLILDQGADVKLVGANLDQMNFVNVQAAGESRILMAAGVPGIVVGAKEGLQAATYSNFALAMRRFANLTIDPLWRSACACLSGPVVDAPQGSQLWYDTRNIAALRQDELERSQALQVQAAAIRELAQMNFEPESIKDYIQTGDVMLLKHPGPMVNMPTQIPLDRPYPIHAPDTPAQLALGAPKPSPPGAAPNRLPAGKAQKGPTAGTVGPTGGTSKPGPNGKTAPSASRK